MSTFKIRPKGGSGGKRGHSNMDHRDTTEIIKEGSKIRRRNIEKKEIRKEIKEWNKIEGK